ncbi:hypothetical protein [Pseudomonas sp. BF-RE-26]|uniref:hypothetical protein n=1 Tax=Pseudomonas sp. BF-RE-26 TaxID=2832396 RepID=UPI001CBE9AB6|nr:hypothetical protein [Pseudomonas sp. BF-RE-26]
MSSEQTVVPLPPPTTDPAPLSNIEGGETNLLHRTAWSDSSNPLKVCFDPWDNSQPSEKDPESIQILLNDVEITRKEWTAPIHPDDLYVAISADKLPSGVHELRYIVTIWSGTPHESDPVTITIDKTPPVVATSSKLVFPSDVLPPNAITAAYLADPAHQDQVLATVPDYSVKKVGDVITWYWELSPGGREVAGSKTLALSDVGQPVQVSFAGDLLRKANGVFYATYRVSDRAGNESVLSVDEKLDVNIRPPIPRKFPTVRQADSTPAGTGILNPFRGTAGVTVVVEASEVDPTEAVRVDFIGLGGEEGIGSVTDVSPTTSGGLEFAIAAPVVAANIPVSGDGRKVEIWYWAGHDPQHSATYTLTISELSADALGSVECPEAQIGSPATLSKSKVASDGANIEIEEWAYHESQHRINVWAMASGVRTDFLKDAPAPLNDKGMFTTSLPKDYVAPLPLNGTFTLYASVSFDQGHSYRTFKPMSMKLVT